MSAKQCNAEVYEVQLELVIHCFFASWHRVYQLLAPAPSCTHSCSHRGPMSSIASGHIHSPKTRPQVKCPQLLPHLPAALGRPIPRSLCALISAAGPKWRRAGPQRRRLWQLRWGMTLAHVRCSSRPGRHSASPHLPSPPCSAPDQARRHVTEAMARCCCFDLLLLLSSLHPAAYVAGSTRAAGPISAAPTTQPAVQSPPQHPPKRPRRSCGTGLYHLPLTTPVDGQTALRSAALPPMWSIHRCRSTGTCPPSGS